MALLEFPGIFGNTSFLSFNSLIGRENAPVPALLDNIRASETIGIRRFKSTWQS